MNDFWENLYQENGALWEYYPSDSALIALDLFQQNKLNKILIPGIGYGRNAKPFIDEGFEVAGIEISQSAIKIAKKEFPTIKIFHGSLTKMPFNEELYDGVFCYATLHLFNENERAQIINKCYNQLNINGLMFFNVISTDSLNDYTGKTMGQNLLKLENNLEVYFYNLEAVMKEFSNYNIIDIYKIQEPIKHLQNQKPINCLNVICRKIF